MGIAQNPRVRPFLDIATAAAHLHAVDRDLACVTAGAELYQRRQNAQDLGHLGVARICGLQHACRMKDHRTPLLGGDQHFHQLPTHQRQVDQLLPKGGPVLRDEKRFGHRAPHQPRRAHAIGQTRHVDHVGHLLEPLPGITHQIGRGPFQGDFAAGHGLGAHFIFQPQNAVGVPGPIRQNPRQQKQRQSARARRCPFGPRKHHAKRGIGVRAEPLVA